LIFKDFPLLRRDGEQQTPADQVKNQRLHNTSHGGCQLFKILSLAFTIKVKKHCRDAVAD